MAQWLWDRHFGASMTTASLWMQDLRERQHASQKHLKNWEDRIMSNRFDSFDYFDSFDSFGSQTFDVCWNMLKLVQCSLHFLSSLLQVLRVGGLWIASKCLKQILKKSNVMKRLEICRKKPLCPLKYMRGETLRKTPCCFSEGWVLCRIWIGFLGLCLSDPVLCKHEGMSVSDCRCYETASCVILKVLSIQCCDVLSKSNSKQSQSCQPLQSCQFSAKSETIQVLVV